MIYFHGELFTVLHTFSWCTFSQVNISEGKVRVDVLIRGTLFVRYHIRPINLLTRLLHYSMQSKHHLHAW